MTDEKPPTKDEIEHAMTRGQLRGVRRDLKAQTEVIAYSRAILTDAAASRSFHLWQAAACAALLRSFGRDPDGPEDETWTPLSLAALRLRKHSLVVALGKTAQLDEHQRNIDTALALIPELEMKEAMYAARLRELGAEETA